MPTRNRIAELRFPDGSPDQPTAVGPGAVRAEVDQLMRRQANLDRVPRTLSGAADPTPTGSIKPPARSNRHRDSPAKPRDSDTVLLNPAAGSPRHGLNRAPCRRSPAASRSKTAAASRPHWHSCRTRSIASQRRQAQLLNGLEESYDARARRMPASSSTSASTSQDPPAPGPPPRSPFVRSRRAATAALRAAALSHQSFPRSGRPPQPRHGACRSAGVPRARPSPRAWREDRPLLPRAGDGTPGSTLRANVASRARRPRPARWCPGAGAAARRMIEIDHGNGSPPRYGQLPRST